MKQKYSSYREEYLSSKGRFYRRSQNAKLLGVCSGLSYRFNLNLTHLRIVVAVAAIFFTAPVIVGYCVTALLTDRI
ncbi:MAG: PspC domain-containing protein [Gammaproteobacteria bacterium]|nr:PspC domain-containing protein [Gammaproteobacteria bacterium]